ncbi:MAG: toprim domain-containing protein, partial [Nitrospira sp.]|nr:toprim domain-containing protein [Nitrospira sp.]
GVTQAGSLVIVEGYLDALAAHQADIPNVVATLGTALTSEHLHLIRRFIHNVILVFDPDLAGVRAALRTVDLFISSGVHAQVVMLPGGEDPDSFIKKYGATAFKDLLSKPVGLLDFALQQIVSNASKKTIEEKLRIINEVLPVLAKIPNHVERSHYLKWVADQLGVQERDLGMELARSLKQSKKVPKQETLLTTKLAPQFPVEEEMLIKLLLQGRVRVDTLQDRVQPEDFTDPRLGQLFTFALATAHHGGEVQIRELLKAIMSDSEINPLVSAWSLQELACEEYEKTALDCVQKLYEKRLSREIREIEEKIREAERKGDRTTVMNLQQGVLSRKRQILLAQQG